MRTDVRLMSVEQVAEYLGCSPANVYRMVDVGLIAYSRIGPGKGRIVFDPADVKFYVQSRRVPATRRPRRVAVAT